MARDLDIIIFGATGFTGKHAIPIVHKLAQSNGNLSWGIAGRSESKLKQLVEDSQKKLSVSDIPIVIADVANEQSLKEMARKARIIINCCGPYRFFGEPVIKACVEEGTHQVDVSGEPEYIEKIALHYHEAAKEKGIYIISACGLDSIPADLGVIFLQQKFSGTLNSVTTYLKAGSEDNTARQGPVINYGTWASLIHSLTNTNYLREIRKQLYPTKLPPFKPKLESKGYPHKTKVTSGWMLPFLGSDRAVVRRSQRYFYEIDKQRPVQIDTYFSAGKSFFNVIALAIMALFLSILTKCNFGKNLLLQHPAFFTFGMFGKEEPSEETIEKSTFEIVLYGEGWKDKLPEPSDQYSDPPNKAIIGKVSGKNPGYGATNIALVTAAIAILNETNKLPAGGGVYPPGAAFAKTNLIKNLNENGVKFEIIEEKDL